jgi:ATP-dependent DNA ligase
MWWVGFNYVTAELTMVFGHVGGKIRTETTQVVTNQSGRNLHEQAVLEARQRYQIKYRNEQYRPPGEASNQYGKPMLARKLEFKPGTREAGHPELKTRLRFPVLVQPKLDGARCLARLDADGMCFRSRGDVRWPHLVDEFGEEVALFLSYLPYQCELDGEVYIHGRRFTEFVRILKNMRVKDPEISQLTYYIYDFHTAAPVVMEERIRLLQDAQAAYEADGHERTRFAVLFTYEATSLDAIFDYHKYFRDSGFEGTIIRKTAGLNPTDRQRDEALYKPGRGLNLIKLKDVDDGEFMIVGVADAEGTETGAALVIIRVTFPNAQGTLITTDVRMRPAYTLDVRREWFLNPKLVIGKMATVEYDSVSEYGVPRNPVMKALRDYDD